MKFLLRWLVVSLLAVPAGVQRADEPLQETVAPNSTVTRAPQSPQPAKPAPSENEDVQAVRAAIASYVDAINKFDAKSLAAHWTI